MFDDLDDEERVDLALGTLEAVERLMAGAHPDANMDVATIAPLFVVINRVCRAAMPKIGSNCRLPRAHND